MLKLHGKPIGRFLRASFICTRLIYIQDRNQCGSPGEGLVGAISFRTTLYDHFVP